MSHSLTLWRAESYQCYCTYIKMPSQPIVINELARPLFPLRLLALRARAIYPSAVNAPQCAFVAESRG